MNKQICAVFFVVALTVVGTAEAQNRGERGGRGRGGLEAMLERMFENDANFDGKLSSDELGERGARLLDRADANDDGFLTKDEFSQMMERRGGRGPRGEAGGQARGAGAGGRGPAGANKAQAIKELPVIRVLDQDGDGALSQEEINNAVEALKKLDKNNDGTISADEMKPDDADFGRGGRGAGRGRPQRPQRNNGGLRTGQSAPDFELRSLDGASQTKLSNLYAKKPVILFFGSYT